MSVVVTRSPQDIIIDVNEITGVEGDIQNGVETCPICQENISNLTIDNQSTHINLCMDSKGPPAVAYPKDSPLTSVIVVEESETTVAQISITKQVIALVVLEYELPVVDVSVTYYLIK